MHRRYICEYSNIVFFFIHFSNRYIVNKYNALLTYDCSNKQNLLVVNIVHAEQNINKQIFVKKKPKKPQNKMNCELMLTYDTPALR